MARNDYLAHDGVKGMKWARRKAKKWYDKDKDLIDKTNKTRSQRTEAQRQYINNGIKVNVMQKPNSAESAKAYVSAQKTRDTSKSKYEKIDKKYKKLEKKVYGTKYGALVKEVEKMEKKNPGSTDTPKGAIKAVKRTVKKLHKK